LRKNLFSGLVILLPIAITLWVIIFLIDLLTNPFIDHVQNILLFATNQHFTLASHPTLLVFISRTAILIMIFVVTLILGYLGKKIFFHWFMKQIHLLMLKIPMINSIYKACKDITAAVFSDDTKIFDRVVSVPFPCKESQSLGLVAGKAPQEIRDKLPPSPTGQPMKVIFVATSPHPTSGFLLLTHEDQLITVDISLEDTFKWLISCGLFLPEHQKK